MKREEFERYLRGLPPDKGFCEDANCPLEEWHAGATANPMSGWRGFFMQELDDSIGGVAAIAKMRPWQHITPAQCLEVLAKVA